MSEGTIPKGRSTMARQKKPPYQDQPEGPVPNDVPTATIPPGDPLELPPSDVNGNLPHDAVTTTPETTPATNGNGHKPSAKKKPVMSFRRRSDRTTVLAAAIFAHDVTYQDGEIGVQYSIMLSKSWQNEQKQ